MITWLKSLFQKKPTLAPPMPKSRKPKAKKAPAKQPTKKVTKQK